MTPPHPSPEQESAKGPPNVCNETPEGFCRELGHEYYTFCINCGAWDGKGANMPPVNRHVYNKYQEGRRVGKAEGKASLSSELDHLR
jgi:hypothetical protein